MSDTKQTPDNNLPTTSVGHPAYPIAKVEEHAIQPIDKQASETHQTLRSMAHVLAQRCLKYSLSVSKSDATKLHALAQTMNIAYQAAYHGVAEGSKAPQHVLIALFGNSGAGESIARNLQRMLPTLRTPDGIVDAEHTPVVTPDQPHSDVK